MIRTVTNQNRESIGLASLQTSDGIRMQFTQTASAATVVLQAGVYLISVSENAYIRISDVGEAGDIAGSFLLGAGASGSVVIKAGQKIHARGVDAAGALYAIPFEKA